MGGELSPYLVLAGESLEAGEGGDEAGLPDAEGEVARQLQPQRVQPDVQLLVRLQELIRRREREHCLQQLRRREVRASGERHLQREDL